MDIRSFDPNFQSDGFLVYVIRKLDFYPWSVHGASTRIWCCWPICGPFDTHSKPRHYPFRTLSDSICQLILHRLWLTKLTNVETPQMVPNTSTHQGLQDFRKPTSATVKRPVRNASQGALVCALGFSAFLLFVVSLFWKKSQNGSCQVFSLCNLKEGLSTLVCPWGQHPYLVLPPHVWTVSRRHVLGEAICNIFSFFSFFVCFFV